MQEFLPAVCVSLAVETLLVLSLLMPVATTVVWYHSSFRRRRLLVMLLVGIFSTGVALTRVLSRRARSSLIRQNSGFGCAPPLRARPRTAPCLARWKWPGVIW